MSNQNQPKSADNQTEEDRQWWNEWCCEHLCWDDLNETINDMCFSECLSLPDPCAEYSEYLIEMMNCNDDPLSEECEEQGGGE